MLGEKAGLLESGPEWGSIKEIVNRPLIDVPADASWLSVILMWLTLPISLIQGIFVGLCQSLFVCVSIGNCCPCTESWCSAVGSVLKGRPFIMAWTWWRYMIGALIALVANGQSRLALFMWEWVAFGSSQYWWHGEGIWMWSYKDCDRILKSEQTRHNAFGCVSACVPDLFSTDLLIFLSNDGKDSEWAALRSALHTHFLNQDGADYNTRINELRGKIAMDWPNPDIQGFNDTAKLQRLVSKCIFYMMFNVWLTDDEATILTGWRTNASIFILPRLIQRFIFNFGINKVKTLREQTVGLVEKYGLQDCFVQMNSALPAKYQRKDVAKLADEIMFVIGFAGIGGTCAAVESSAAFMQCKIPKESAAKHIDFGEYDTTTKMQTKYMMEPETWIREVLRMDPPVTSATGVLKEATEVMLAGRKFSFQKGLLNQYVLSMANRDEEVFPQSSKFNPDRDNLNRAFTWNGAFGATASAAQDEKMYPRICPGRYLSLDIAKVVISHGLGMSDLALNRTGAQRSQGMGCCG